MVHGIRCFVLAVTLLSVFAHAPCWAQTSSRSDEYREFEDQRGRTVMARIVEAGGNKVTIQRRDGRKFTVDVSVVAGKSVGALDLCQYHRLLQDEPAPASATAAWFGATISRLFMPGWT